MLVDEPATVSPLAQGRPGKIVSVLVTPWGELGRETVRELLAIKASSPHHANTTLRIRIMASSVSERAREELVARKVEVAPLSWHDPKAMQLILKDIQKVLFIPGYSSTALNWAAAILEAVKIQPTKLSLFIRVGMAGMNETTTLGRWGKTINEMFEAQEIPTTTLHVNQLYQEMMAGTQGQRTSTITSTYSIPPDILDATIAPIDARDVSVLLANIILNDSTNSRRNSEIVVNGPSSISFRSVGQMVGKSLCMEGGLNSLGMMVGVGAGIGNQPEILAEVWEVYRKGGAREINEKAVEKMELILGRKMCKLEDYLEEYVVRMLGRKN